MGRISEREPDLLLLEGFSAARAVASAVGALPVGLASVTMPCTCQVPAGVSPATLLMGCEAGGCGPSRLPLALFSLLGVPGRPKPGTPHTPQTAPWGRAWDLAASGSPCLVFPRPARRGSGCQQTSLGKALSATVGCWPSRRAAWAQLLQCPA